MINFCCNPKYFGMNVLNLKNETYLDFIRSQKCIVPDEHFQCSDQPRPDAHHVGNEKENDYLAVPLCRAHHNDYHFKLGSVEKFNDKYNIDLMWVIINLMAFYASEKL